MERRRSPPNYQFFFPTSWQELHQQPKGLQPRNRQRRREKIKERRRNDINDRIGRATLKNWALVMVTSRQGKVSPQSVPVKRKRVRWRPAPWKGGHAASSAASVAGGRLDVTVAAAAAAAPAPAGKSGRRMGSQ